MNIHYAKTDPHELLKWVTWETQCLMDLRRENQAELQGDPLSASTSPDRNVLENLDDLDDFPVWLDNGINLYRQCIQLIGKAWDLEQEAESALHGLCETAPDTDCAEGDTWTPVGDHLLPLLRGLFETCVGLDQEEQRLQIYQLAKGISDFHGLDIHREACTQETRLQSARELQVAISKEAAAMIVLLSTDAKVHDYREVILLIQKAWELSDADTQPWLDAIDKAWELAERGSPDPVSPEEALPIHEAEEDVLGRIWRLFETAVRLPVYADRNALFNLSVELSQFHNLCE